MASQKYDSFKDLRKGKYDWKVKARIMKLWRGYTKTGEPFKPFNLLLLDHKRSRVHAFVPTSVAEALEPSCVLGQTFLFQNFTVKEYKPEDKFRCIRKNIQIVFSNDTKIIPIDENDVFIENACFDFYDFGDLKPLSQQTTYLTDVIGVIEEQELTLNKVRNRFGAFQTQMKFHITDGRETVKVTLWDEFAELLNHTLEEDLEYPLIIIIGCGRVTEWQNKIDISNVQDNTFYLNYYHHSVIEMRKMLTEPAFAEYRKSFQKKTPPKLYTIEKIKDLGDDSIESEVLCKVNIANVLQMEKWCDPYCTSCYNQVKKVDNIYHCNKCPRELNHPLMWYNLLIVATDETGKMDIMLENQAAQKCIGKKAWEIYNEDHEEIYPDILKTIEKKDYTLKLFLNEANIKQTDQIYVAKDIIEESYGHIVKIEKETQIQDSYGQPSGTTYHLESMSENN